MADADHLSDYMLAQFDLPNQTPTIRRHLPTSIAMFLSKFPDGFYDEQYLKQERNPILKVQHLAQTLLGKEAMTTLLDEKNHQEIVKRVSQVVDATDMFSPNEKRFLIRGLSIEPGSFVFAQELHNLLYGEYSLPTRFGSFLWFILSIRTGKWTTATYFPFLLQPEKYLFVDTFSTLCTGNFSDFRGLVVYPNANPLLYKLILNFAEHLKAELKELQPRDMIDIREFMRYM